MKMNTTASTLRAILCFIDPKNTRKIAFDNDALAKPLADKIKLALKERDGDQFVAISFTKDERELERQFNGMCSDIRSTFESLEYVTNKNF